MQSSHKSAKINNGKKAFSLFLRKVCKNKTKEECFLVNERMSRIERLWEKLEDEASLGNWSYQATQIYPSEARRIEKQWNVEVKVIETNGKLFTVNISWKRAFTNGLNSKQAWYIAKLLDEMPMVETLAQQLYLMAARA